MRTLLAFLLTCSGQYAPACKGRGVAFDLPSCLVDLTSNLEPPLIGVPALIAAPGRGGIIMQILDMAVTARNGLLRDSGLADERLGVSSFRIR